MEMVLGSHSQSGMIREAYNSFGINSDTATQAGLVEFLKRIKEDNCSEGFMLTKYIKINVASQVFYKLGKHFKEIFTDFYKGNKIPSDHTYEMKFALDKSILEVREELSREHVFLSYNEISILVDFCIEESFWRDFNKKDYSPEKDKFLHYFWEYLGNQFNEIGRRYQKTYTRVEYDYEHVHHRKNAIVSYNTVANLRESEIESLALEVLKLVKGNEVILLTPEPELALECAQKAIDKYHVEIERAKSIYATIYAIVSLVQELERLHLFHDVNLRTNYFLLNQLLTENGIKPTMLYNPNRMDGYSAEEFCEEVIQGILRYDYVILNHNKLSEKNTEDIRYPNISQPLEAVLDIYDKHIKNIISKIDNLFEENKPSSHSYFQPEEPIKKLYMQIKKLVNKLKEAKNTLQFFINLEKLDLTLLPSMVKDEMELLKKLLHVDESMKWSEAISEKMMEEEVQAELNHPSKHSSTISAII